MLTDYRLDTETFSDMMDEARNMAVSLYPEWTDFNYHDPGITMLELFAWIKEGQQFFLDQIGPEHLRKYLKLLGISPGMREAAKAYVNIETQTDLTLQAGTRFFAGDVLFETKYRQCVPDNAIIECFHAKNELEDDCAGGQLERNANLRLPIFGMEPGPEDAWYIGFAEALPLQERIGIYIRFAGNSDGTRRNPLNGPLPVPLLRFCCEYHTGEEWRPADSFQDDTFGLLQDGMLYIKIEKQMRPACLYGRQAYYIRIRVIESDIDYPPVLESIRLNVVLLQQTDTWAQSIEKTAKKQGGRYMVSVNTFLGAAGTNELYVSAASGDIYYPAAAIEKYLEPESGEASFFFQMPQAAKGCGEEPKAVIVSFSDEPGFRRCLGIGTGLPDQEYELPSVNVLYESVRIFVHEIGSGGGYARWQRVGDFGASLPEDKHFTVDTKEGRIRFGDCEHGMAPEGEILLLSFAKSEGQDGNVKKGTITRFFGMPDTARVHNAQDAAGGKNEESLEAGFLRARRAFKKPDTAVTYEDYERLVRQTPGLAVTACRAVPADEMHRMWEDPKENTLCLVVKAGGRSGLTDSCRRNILAHLEPFRLLGTKLRITAPCEISLEVYMDVTVKPHYQDAEMQLRREAERYFKELSAQFGAVIVYSELYGRIDMLACVAAVNDITLDIRDSRVKTAQDGNIILPPNGTARLKQVHVAAALAD